METVLEQTEREGHNCNKNVEKVLEQVERGGEGEGEGEGH